jgi:oxygen-independent coproporphyrinogen-3 oxidase
MPLVPGSAEADRVRSLYVHAPFCAGRCTYCGFAVTIAGRGDAEAWLSALASELELVVAEGEFPLADRLGTLFVGGGTPSQLGPTAMEGLSRILGEPLLAGPDLEWTAEANPESYGRTVARGWARAGVNRISLGAQSFQPAVLRWMGRLHGPPEIGRAVKLARDTGTANVNLDLIFGLPATLHRSWDEELDRALALEVPHLSVYGLSVERGTPFARAVRDQRIAPASDEQYRQEYLQASRRLQAEGYVHYEVSNFALPGFEARHNRAYWDLVPYLGLGNSAHSFRYPRRRWNLRSWEAYRGALSRGLRPLESEELLSGPEVRLERIWLGLRTNRGVAVADLGPAALSVAERWCKAGYAETREGGLRVTPEGWLVLDSLVVELDSVLDAG